MEENILDRFNFYNSDIKKRFFSEMENENSIITMAYAISKATSTEEIFNSDLYNFNLDQIELVMKNINPKNLSSSRNYLAIFKKYISWAYENGYHRSNINLIENIDNSWHEKFLSTQQSLFSEKGLREVEKQLVNYQDSLPLRLAFNGIIGNKLSEMINLKIDDVEGNMVTVCDENGETRIVRVDDRCVELIEKAYNEKIYQNYNGKASRVAGRELEDSKFILRPLKKKATVSYQLEYFSLLGRLRRIKTLVDLPLLSPKNLERSGIIYDAFLIGLEKGRFDKEGFDILTKKYVIQQLLVDGKYYYNKTIYRNFLKSETIKELYGEEVEVVY